MATNATGDKRYAILVRFDRSRVSPTPRSSSRRKGAKLCAVSNREAEREAAAADHARAVAAAAAFSGQGRPGGDASTATPRDTEVRAPRFT
jgi:predicted pyridoxine 5'-phosphate oxidase superfamily flavin-nucleotide-binding protein